MFHGLKQILLLQKACYLLHPMTTPAESTIISSKKLYFSTFRIPKECYIDKSDAQITVWAPLWLPVALSALRLFRCFPSVFDAFVDNFCTIMCDVICCCRWFHLFVRSMRVGYNPGNDASLAYLVQFSSRI